MLLLVCSRRSFDLAILSKVLFLLADLLCFVSSMMLLSLKLELADFSCYFLYLL